MWPVKQRFGPVMLAVLVFAGQFKANPLLAWVPVDFTGLAMVLVILAGIMSRVQEGKTTGRFAVPLIVWVLFFPAIAVASMDAYTVTKLTTLFSVSLVLAIAPFFLLRTAEQQRAFVLGIAALGLFASIALLLGERGEGEYARLTLEGGQTIGTARVVMAAAIVLLLWAFRPDATGRVRLLALIAGVGLVVLAFMTGSRGPTLAGAVAIVVTVLVAPAFRRRRGRAIVGAVVLGAIAVAVAANQAGFGFVRILSVFSGDSGSSTLARQRLWDVAAESIARHPFGRGWGSFNLDGGTFRYPHNVILEVGYELGWFALLAAIALITFAIVRAARLGTSTTGAAMFALLIFAVLNAMVSSDINGGRLLIVALFAAFAIPVARRTESATAEPQGREHRPNSEQTRRGRARLRARR